MPESSYEKESRPIRTDGGEALYKSTVERFEARLKSNVEQALRQYGLTLYHSLPAAQRLRLGDQLKLNPDNAITDYDLGVLAASEQDWDAAIQRFKNAYEKDNTLREALYNWALAAEKKGDKAKARDLFLRLIEAAKDDVKWAADIEKVKSHIAEMESSAAA